MRPAARQAHDDLATCLTELVLGLFDGAQLKGLQGPLEQFRALADPTTVRRALLSQIRYVADVATSLPRDVYSTSGGLFRLAWRTCKGYALTLCLRTVYLFVPRPVAACLRALPPSSGPPVLTKVSLPETPPNPCTYLAAYWKIELPSSPSADFVPWHMSRITCGALKVCPNLLEHLQIPQSKSGSRFWAPLAITRCSGFLRPHLADLHRLGWRTELVLQIPQKRAPFWLSLQQPHDIAPPGDSFFCLKRLGRSKAVSYQKESLA